MPKPEVIDYFTPRIREDDKIPSDTYDVEVVALTYDGKHVLKIVKGPYAGRVFIGGYALIGMFNQQTLH